MFSSSYRPGQQGPSYFDIPSMVATGFARSFDQPSGEPLGNSIRRMLNEMRGEAAFPLTPYAVPEPPAVQQPAGVVAHDEGDLRRPYYADNLAKNQQYYGTASGKQELANMDPGWKAMMKATGSI